MMRGNWNYPTQIRFGAGRIGELAEVAGELGIARPLLVSDPILAGLPIHATARGVLDAGGRAAACFHDIDRNPTGADVAAGVQAYGDAGCDGVVAFGGGAALDVAKAVALMVGQRRPLWDFEDIGDNFKRVVESGMAPVVAVPTTSGTGSEVGRASVIVESATHTKRIIFHPKMLPARVICDPALTIGLPAGVTAAVGMDALSHSLEAYCAPGHHPMADGIAIQAMSLVHRSLVRATQDGTDIDARAGMMAASTMGATAFQKGLGAMHAIAHPVGAIHNTHHGLTNAILMPHVLRFNLPAIEDRLERLARWLGLRGASGFLSWVLELRQTLGIPHTLDALGLRPEHAAALTPMALADPSAGGNPIPLEPESLHALIKTAIGPGTQDAAALPR
jgi:alcohol dehydrogenase class IV